MLFLRSNVCSGRRTSRLAGCGSRLCLSVSGRRRNEPGLFTPSQVRSRVLILLQFDMTAWVKVYASMPPRQGRTLMITSNPERDA